MGGSWPNFLPELGFKSAGSFEKCAVCRDAFRKAQQQLDQALANPDHPFNRGMASEATRPEALRLLGALLASLPVNGTFVRYGDTPVCLTCARRLASKTKTDDEDDPTQTGHVDGLPSGVPEDFRPCHL
jgi:hypothetical protein